MTNKMLTILTPAYNRVNTLPTLYTSLTAQTNKDFTWFVIDDGSTDNTEELMRGYQRENSIEIIYKRKSNAGKHTALNQAIPYIESELTFIVDSDDWVTPDAVDEIINIHKKYKGTSGLCGYSFLRKKPDGSPMINKQFKRSEFTASFTECRINDNFMGDMAEIWFTQCLAEFPFPEFPGERFLSEDVVWLKMSEKYKLVFIDKAIYISEYLDGGLTRNRRRHNIQSPNGCVLRAEITLDADIKLRYKARPAIQYIIYGRFAGKNIKTLFKNSRHRVLFVLALPAALVLYRVWDGKFQM